jgi:hypothetical protein
MAEATLPVQNEPSALSDGISELYDSAIAAGQSPMQFRIFDPQLADVLTLEWLCAQIDNENDKQELLRLVEEGYIRQWPVSGSSYGFTLYSHEEFKFIKELRELRKYDDAEIKYILQRSQRDIDGTLEILPYEQLDTPDLDAFRNRLLDLIEEEEEQIKWRTENNSDLGDHKLRLDQWKRWQALATGKTETDLTEKQKNKIARMLFHLRFVDEWVRITNSERYRALIRQGYSPEAFFRSYEHRNLSEVTFGNIDWALTLDSFQRTRAEGARFPLRTPDFYVSENGIHFFKYLNPGDYLAVYERHKLDELFKLLESLGTELWFPTGVAVDQVKCAGCGNLFRRTVLTKQYCSDKCRNRVRSRRWRARDPERARMAQARYWKSYGEEEL